MNRGPNKLNSNLLVDTGFNKTEKKTLKKEFHQLQVQE